MSKSPYFKVGDTFSVSGRFYDTETDDGVEITSQMTISSRIITKSGILIADAGVFPYIDQINDKGWFNMFVTDTSEWPVGEAQSDIKLLVNGNVKHSASYCFKIVKSITP